jgi:hypothetical protein
MASSGMWLRLSLMTADVSEERVVSIFDVETIQDLEAALGGG